MGKKEKIPPPGNKKDEYTNFMSKAKWKQALSRQVVELAGKNLRAYGALVVGNAMAKSKFVVKIDFSHNNFGDQGAIDFAQVLKVNEFLQSVDLSCNNITDIGGVALASAFIPAANPTGQPAQWNRSLWYFNVSGNLMSDDALVAFANAIACNRQFTRLDFRNNQVGSLGCRELTRAWKRNAQCVVLLSGNPLGDEGVAHLCNAWRHGAQVSMSLSNCDVSKGGAEAIGNLLAENATVRDLNLSWNTLGYKGTEALVDRLHKRCVLYSINLQENCLDDDAGEEIARLMDCGFNTLKKIDISRNEIGDKGGEAIAKALARNPFVETIMLSHNKMTDRSMEHFAETIRGSKTLVMIDLKRNPFTVISKDKIFAAQTENGATRVDMGNSSADEQKARFDGLMKKIGEHMANVLQEEENAKNSKKKKSKA